MAKLIIAIWMFKKFKWVIIEIDIIVRLLVLFGPLYVTQKPLRTKIFKKFVISTLTA